MAAAVLFDFGGTLDADGYGWCERFHRGYHGAGGRLDSEAFEQPFRVSERVLRRVPGMRELGFSELVTTQVQVLSELLPDGRTLDPEAWAAGFGADARRAAARNRLILDRLRDRFDLGVVSNFTGNLRPCLTELGLEDCFEVIFDSAVIGIEKPDLRLFLAAFDALGRHPEECWMVGDNPSADIAPATRLGCPTCWMAPAERPLPDEITPTCRISALTQLPPLLD